MKRAYDDTAMGKIHFRRHGRGAPLSLLHQTPRSSAAFEPLMKLLGRDFGCPAPDTLGFGNSDPLPARATMTELGRSMVRFLDTQGIDRAHVQGFHTGNKIAAALAAGWPDRVGRVVLIGMTHGIVVARKQRNAAIIDIVKKYMTSYQPAADGAHHLRKWADDYAGIAAIWWNQAMTGVAKITAAELRRQALRAIESIQCRDDVKAIYAMNLGFDLIAVVKRIKASTLVIECRVPEEAHLGQQRP
ncbi:MAG: alpha/beta hydrolase, partial [Alphaproteobacteria bacterium]|nr:alpha/beta hydrolase [Alphaproteobacteria bacterium]